MAEVVKPLTWYRAENGVTVFCVGHHWNDWGTPEVATFLVTMHVVPHSEQRFWSPTAWKRFLAKASVIERPAVDVRGRDCRDAAADCERRAAEMSA